MTLNELEQDLYRRLGFASAPADPVVTTRLRAYLNQTQREVLSQKGLHTMRQSILTVVSRPGDPYLAINPAGVRVIALVDRTNKRVLTPVPLSNLRQVDPGLTSTASIPECYAVVSMSAISTRPTKVAGLSIRCSLDADGATKGAYVQITSPYDNQPPGDYQVASVQLNGTTPVNFSDLWPINSYITKFYLGPTPPTGALMLAAGPIFLHEGLGATGIQLAHILGGHSAARPVTGLQLYPVPSTAVTYHADVELRLEDMSIAGDTPLLPEDFHWVLTSGALLKEWQRMEKTSQYDREKTMYRDGIGDLKMFVARAAKADGKNGNGNGLHGSSFGPWYPVGGVGTAAPHAPTHEPGGNDPMLVDALPTIGSLRTLGSGPHQAAPGDDPRFTSGGGGPHHLTHESGGTDALSVVLLAGYPGGTTGFLRADATFATPTAGAVAHHVTHEPGGSDALQLTAASRLFGRGSSSAGAVQEIALGTGLAMSGTTLTATGGVVPGAHHTTHEPGGTDAMAVDAAAAIGSLRTLGTGPNQAAPGNDARFTTPGAHHVTHEPGGTDALVNAAWTNQDNVFTGGNTFTESPLIERTAPGLFFWETDQPADQRVWEITGQDRDLYLFPLADGGASVNAGLKLSRDGSAAVANNLNVTGAGGNVACKNQPNTFTQPQTISDPTLPALFLNETGAPANLRQWKLVAASQAFLVQPANDAGTGLLTAIQAGRDGSVAIGNSLSVSGSGGNVACKNQQNVFTQPQTIQMAGLPYLAIIDTNQPANLRGFRIVVNNQAMFFEVINDAGAGLGSPLALNRGGDALVFRDVYEKGRAVPMGHWSAEPFNAGNFVPSAGTWTVTSGQVLINRYAIIGKTVTWTCSLENSTIAGATTATVYIRLPGGLSSTPYSGATRSVFLASAGAQQSNVLVRVDPNFVYAAIMCPGANIAPGTLSIYFTLTFELV